PGTVAEMTRNQLTPAQRARVWPGFSFLGDRGWGYGVSVTEWGYTWEGGSGTAWSNTPDQDLTVVVLTRRAPDETGMRPCASRSGWPCPVSHLGGVLALLAGVGAGLDALVDHELADVAGRGGQAGYPVDHVHDQVVAAQGVQHDHVQGRGGGGLVLVPVDGHVA